MRLIDEHTGTGPRGQAGFNFTEKIVVQRKGVRRFADPDPARDATFACAIVKLRRQQIGRHAAFSVVMGGLQQHRRLAGVHR